MSNATFEMKCTNNETGSSENLGEILWNLIFAGGAFTPQTLSA